ncbi:MAG TPA: hypothetical protein VFT61_08945 [Sphingomicrobium sp.]|nr:hypothetical protein [Sphingomicrobium sp.]
MNDPPEPVKCFLQHGGLLSNSFYIPLPECPLGVESGHYVAKPICMAKAALPVATSTIVVILWPPLVGAAYLAVRPEAPPLVFEYAALVLALLPGVVALWWLCPFKGLSKAALAVALTVPYAWVMGTLLVEMALRFTCARFGNCL